jgi:hypothetical protein
MLDIRIGTGGASDAEFTKMMLLLGGWGGGGGLFHNVEHHSLWRFQL